MATNMKSIVFYVDEEIDDMIIALRKNDKFIRSSKSDIVRYLINEGLKVAEEEAKASTKKA